MTREHATRGRTAVDLAPGDACAAGRPDPCAGDPAGDCEIVDDGQEEVFSRTAIEKGLVKDPKALGPEDLGGPESGPGPASHQPHPRTPGSRT
jgi:hypothetical protein